MSVQKEERAFQKYADMLDLPHHVSAVHPPMSMADRAAQFAPFSALTGYGAAVKERARLTKGRPQLDEGEMERINRSLLWLKEHLLGEPEVAVTYFLPDQRKEGGAYMKADGKVRKLSEEKLVMADGKEILVEDLLEIELK